LLEIGAFATLPIDDLLRTDERGGVVRRWK